jgi:5-methylcytosine-specific restriction endonuclease McrA
MEDVIVSTSYDGKMRTLTRRECKTCGDSFYAPIHREGKYCSIPCSRIGSRTRVREICDQCGKGFDKRPSSYQNSKSGMVFCSRKCKDTAQRIESNHPEIHPPQYGTSDGAYSYRDIAFRNNPHRCNRCGYCEYVGILKVHHRDRNRHNNDLENLEILCPNCHDLDHFFYRDGGYSGGRKKKFGAVFGNGNLLPLHGGDVSSILTGSTTT